MLFLTPKAVVSYLLSLSLLASQGQVAQARLLAPSNCQAADFELPAALVGAWTEEPLPPFVTVEIFATIAALKGGWSPGFASTETPIVARLVHLLDTMAWNCAAMYSSTWLDGLTKEDPLLRSPVSLDGITLHESKPRLLCMVHAWAAVVNEWHPESNTTLSEGLAAFEYEDVSFGFNSDVDAAFDMETGEADKDMLIDIAEDNCYKPKIMGAIVARQLTEYGRRDGYNMYGDLHSDGTPCTHNCRRYTDSTGYKIKTRTIYDTNESKWKKYKWTPMLEDNGRGYFTRQEFVTPHIGTTAKRAILSDEDFESRVAKDPRHNTNKYNREAEEVAERLRATATDDMKKAKIEFYDNKIAVTFAIFGSVASYGLSFEQCLNFGFGLTSSEYDSILVAWKEKVAFDLVRPTTWIQERMSEQEFTTYAGPNQGVQTIKGKDFESWARVMPHSEYISGSACVCQSLKDYTDEWMELTVGSLPGAPNSEFVSGGSIAVAIATDMAPREAPFLAGSSTIEPGVTPSSNLTLVAETMTDLRDQCGQSRLDGGMHFDKAVSNAYTLCEGIGNQAAAYSIELLGEGGWEDTIVDGLLPPSPDSSDPINPQ